jgi:hypothetical protein
VCIAEKVHADCSPHQASPSVASIVASRLAYGAGQRGFGNARAVRRRQILNL